MPSDKTNIRLTSDFGYTKKSEYMPGIGSTEEYSILTRVIRQATGWGFKEKKGKMLEKLETNISNGDFDIDVIGFSRGAVTAILFVETIKSLRDSKEYPYCEIENVRFLGIYDPVTGPGHTDPSISENFVKKTSIAYSMDEKRREFQPSIYQGGAITALGFRGGHSDVGGGYKERGLANISLEWMLGQGIAAGAPFRELNTKSLGDGFSSQMTRHQEDAGFWTFADRNLSVQPHLSINRLRPWAAQSVLTPRFRINTTGYVYYLDSIDPSSGNDYYNVGDHKF